MGRTEPQEAAGVRQAGGEAIGFGRGRPVRALLSFPCATAAAVISARECELREVRRLRRNIGAVGA